MFSLFTGITSKQVHCTNQQFLFLQLKYLTPIKVSDELMILKHKWTGKKF